MKTTSKKILILTAILLVGINLYAYDFIEDGIYYKITSPRTVAITYRSYNESSNTYFSDYSGDFVIPEQVTTFSYVSLSDITYSVTSIDYKAFYKSSVRSVTIPNSITTIGKEAFSYCDGLTSITIPNSITTIGDEAFSYCDGLTSVNIANSATSIGDKAFYGCDNLMSVELGDYVTSIGDEAFSIKNLTFNSLPLSITSFGDFAFDGCNLPSVLILGKKLHSIGREAFGWWRSFEAIISLNLNPPTFDPNLLTLSNCYDNPLYVPKEALKAYMSSDSWSHFRYIRPIEDGNVSDVADDAVSVTSKDGSIVVRGTDNTMTEVYILSGQLVYSGTDTVINVPTKGIYIVRISGKIYKIAVL